MRCVMISNYIILSFDKAYTSNITSRQTYLPYRGISRDLYTEFPVLLRYECTLRVRVNRFVGRRDNWYVIGLRLLATKTASAYQTNLE